jgi:hypothetical protein
MPINGSVYNIKQADLSALMNHPKALIFRSYEWIATCGKNGHCESKRRLYLSFILIIELFVLNNIWSEVSFTKGLTTATKLRESISKMYDPDARLDIPDSVHRVQVPVTLWHHEGSVACLMIVSTAHFLYCPTLK